MTGGVHHGGCMCGATSYEVQGDPIVTHCCHCSECQKQNGSAFAVNALYESDRMRLLAADTIGEHMPAASGHGQTVHKCATCGVILWSHYSRAGSAIAFLRVGTLDEQSACPPDVHIFTSTKRPWVSLTPEIPAFEGFYDPKSTLTESALQRWAAALT